ncbi:MAG: HAMP domain-containing histidine kinase [Kangiellaceae bacterium]|nr:HAMP domain-containing histidine kinase [Kangiellaceae bacterium]MCW9015412.1 HAMP domain-containing histidine kinase [Kangiellaceae bacterium]
MNYAISSTNKNESGQSGSSVSQYVFINFSLLLVLILAFYSYSVHITYTWGNDDSFHYFLSLHAENYNAGNNQSMGNIDEESFNIYLSYHDLPSEFKADYPKENIQAGVMLVHETEENFSYILPFQNERVELGNNELSFVEHTYLYSEDEYDPGISIPQLTGLLGLFTFIFGFLFYLRIAKKLTTQIKLLADWVRKLEINRPQNSPEHIPKARFTEIQEVAAKFQVALDSIRQKTEREKNFLKSLSHELRTPLAIIKASLELIEKKAKDLPGNVKNKLIKIQTANQNMCDTSESLLHIWSGSSKLFEACEVDLNDLLSKSIKKYQHLIGDKSITTKFEIAQEPLMVPNEFAQIVIDNVLKNAFQYSSEGEIEVRFENGQFTIINPLSNDNSYTLADKEPGFTESNFTEPNFTEYGYGVGLFVVETICERMQWKFFTEKLDGMFRTVIDFSS